MSRRDIQLWWRVPRRAWAWLGRLWRLYQERQAADAEAEWRYQRELEKWRRRRRRG